MLNKTILIGRMVADAEIRTTGSGVAIASFTLAVNRTFKSANGERETDFIRCICFQKTAENLGKYTNKGSQIAVEGRIQTRSYDGQDGKKVYVTEVVCESVVFLDSKSEQTDQDKMSNYKQNTNRTYNNNAKNTKHDDYLENDIEINEDDLPF